MAHDDVRKSNQQQLLGLASVYKGLTRKQLADALGRDQTRLFPANGNPKLDYLIRLADVLDWPVGDVAEAIWDRGAPDPLPDEPPDGADFDALNAAARDAHRAGKFALMSRIAQRMYAVARTPQQRALACHRESGAWDGLGRYTRQLEAVRRGLAESPIDPELRLLLRVNLANSYYTLWHLHEARAMARDIIDEIADPASALPSGSTNVRAANAFAHYVLGNASRRLIALEPDRRIHHARAARAALQTALDLYTALADERDNPAWRGIANTCRAGIIEADVELGAIAPLDAVAALAAGLSAVDEPPNGAADAAQHAGPVGDGLESYGWWCIFGCNIALRHLAGRDLQRHMAIFTNKGYEIADRLDNWSMRERLFSLEFLQRQRLNDLAGFPVDWTIDHEEVRVIVGTMGRFPMFRSTGWKILQTATVVGDN
mgnify:FL=1